jgi:replicative DNA helicase
MPMLSDLRESGEIEQSADGVWFFCRSEEKEERVKLHVAKHRNGPTGEIDLYFVGSETRFYPVVNAATRAIQTTR